MSGQPATRVFRAIVFAYMLVATRAIAASGQTASEHWYVIHLGTAPAGWMRQTESLVDNGIAVTTATHFALNRLNKSVVMDMSSRSTESSQGHWLTSDAVLRLSDQATETQATNDGDSVIIRARAGGREFARRAGAPRALIGPAAADRLTSASLHAPGDSIVFGEFDASATAPAVVTRRLTAIETIAIGGHSVVARRFIEQSTASPLTTTYWIDSAGLALRSAFDSPFGKTESELTDSATAMSAAGATMSEDQYTQTVAATQVRIPQARNLAMLRLSLTRLDTALAWPAFDEPGQRVISRTADRVEIEITRANVPVGFHPFPVAATPANREYLEPNAYVQSDEPRLHALALRIVGSETDEWAASVALLRWVSDSVHFDAGVTFAPSVEVFENRRGTCVAFATLLATLTRTLGIPSRVAFGFGYVNGIFGGHAWTEVLIGDSWIGLDGALYADGPADAARFAFTHASLARGPADLTNSAGSQLYGRIRVAVLGYRVSGESSVVVAENAKSYRVDGDVYVNATLGLSLRKPPATRFVELNATWPNMTLAGIVDAKGDTVRLSVASRTPALDPAGKTAIAVLPNGCEFLVLDATGPGGRAMLARVVQGLLAVPDPGD